MCLFHKTIRSSFDVELRKVKITRKFIRREKSLTSCFKWIIKKKTIKRNAISRLLTIKSEQCDKERF